MQKIDFKKTDKALYAPSTNPEIITVPPLKFIMVDGAGDPNTSPDYEHALQILYALSYQIKMRNKDKLEYVVGPLEGLWSLDDEDFMGGGEAIADKSKFIWTMMIRQPDFVDEAIFAQAKEQLAKKKPELDLSRARLESYDEGLSVQVMHLGSYDEETHTVQELEHVANEQGYVIDIGGERKHHEIYLSDPRKVAPEKLKTVLRHPVKKA